MKLKDLFMQQKMMRRVVIATLPLILYSVWLFGWRSLTLLAVVLIAGVVSEYLVMRLINGAKAKVSEAALVTCVLFTLTLPPTTPYWVAVVGIVFGLVMGKGVFGGFGRNIFNPALVGRCFIYVSFPAHMTVTWMRPFGGLLGGLTHYTGGVDAITSVTPMIEFDHSGTQLPALELFLGRIGGSLGETSALLILLVAVYLIATKTASWRIMLSTAVSFTLLSSALYLGGLEAAPDPLFAILSGGVLFAIVLMTTDPVSAPQREGAKVIYGALIGVLAVVIRTFSIFTEGIMFAILIANMFAPLIDRQLRELAQRRQAKAAPAQAAAGTPGQAGGKAS